MHQNCVVLNGINFGFVFHLDIKSQSHKIQSLICTLFLQVKNRPCDNIFYLSATHCKLHDQTVITNSVALWGAFYCWRLLIPIGCYLCLEYSAFISDSNKDAVSTQARTTALLVCSCREQWSYAMTLFWFFSIVIWPCSTVAWFSSIVSSWWKPCAFPDT